jgi:hypothetical protein
METRLSRDSEGHRVAQAEFEARYVQQQLDLTQSLERAYSLTNGLKGEIEEGLQKQMTKELRRVIEFKE